MSVPEAGSLVLAVVLGAGGLHQLAGAAPMRQMAQRLDLGYPLFRFIGCCQVAGAVGLVAGVVVETWIGVAAAYGLALLALLGLGAHRRAKEPLAAYLPAVVLGGLALAVALTL